MNTWPRQLVTERLTMNSYLLFLILGTVVVKNAQAASTAKETFLELKASVDKCAKEAGFTEEQLNTALKSHDKNADDKAKCFRGCLLQAHKVITDDKDIDENAAIKFYHGDKLETLRVAILKCIEDTRKNFIKSIKSDTESNHCEIAHKFESCMCSSLTAC